MSARGSRGFYGHDDRGGDRGGNRGRGDSRGRMGNRGGFGAPIIKRYNRPKFGGPMGGQGFGRRDGGNRARFQDEDGDVEMQGGGNLPDHMRNRFWPLRCRRHVLEHSPCPVNGYAGYFTVSLTPHTTAIGKGEEECLTGEGAGMSTSHHISRNEGNEVMWYKVAIPQGKKHGKDFILREIKARISVPLIPYNFQYDGNNAIFFINDPATAAAVRSLNRVIDTPSGFKMAITVKGSELPTVSLDEEIFSGLKMVMGKRYDATRCLLNLSNFHNEEALKELNLYITLSRSSVMSVAIKIIVENIPEVQTLDLSNNRLITLYPLGPLHSVCKQLHSLNLANNKITKMAELDSMKGMSSVQELILEGNPVCNAYNDKTEYVSAVRERFPKVILLDHNELPPPISFDLGLEETMPLSKPSYFPSEEVKQVVVQFIEQYFTIFDSKDRSGLLDAYHDNAVFSLTAVKLATTKTDVKEFQRDSRNLVRMSNTESRRERLKSGRLNIVSFLNQLPETRHDPSSFTVDIPLVTPTLMCFAVFGILRLVHKGLILPPLRSFTRNFFVVPQGAGFSIINETLFITGGTEDQIRVVAYTVLPGRLHLQTYPTPENTPSTSSPAAPSATGERDRLITELCAQTRMNRAFAERCLEQTDWNIQKAFTVFSEINVRGGIPPEAFQA